MTLFTGSRDRLWFLLGCMLSLCVLGTYYGWGWARGEDTSLLVMYRPGVGDFDYFPLARQFGEGRMGDHFTSGHLHEGWVAFPCFSVLAHGLALSTLGPLGFALADILAPCVYFAVAFRLLRAVGASAAVSALLAVFVTLRGFAMVGDFLVETCGYRLHMIPFFLQFLQMWTLRFPRTLISEIYVLGALGSWLILIRQGLGVKRGWWIGVAFWMAGMLQSDIYSFAALGLVFAAALGWHAFGRPRPPGVGKNFALGLGLFFLLAVPFVIQQLQLTEDVAQRFGVFPFARSRVLELAPFALHFFPGAFALVVFALPWAIWAVLRWRGDSGSYPTSLAVALTGLHLAAYVAMPAFVLLAGKGVQLYHFRDTAHTLLGWSAIANLALAFTAVARSRVFSARPLPRVIPAAGLVVAVVLLVGMVNQSIALARGHLTTPGLPRQYGLETSRWTATYHADFRALGRELSSERYRDARILATVESEVYSWWTGMLGRHSFLAHPFSSPLPDEMLVPRIVTFARLNQIPADGFVPWIVPHTGYDTIHNIWISSARYSANPLYTYAPLADYTAEERLAIARAAPLDTWHLVMPQSERRRFAALYAADLRKPEPKIEFDLMVVSHRWPALDPDPRRFRLVYENPTFRVYRPASAVAGSGPATND